jgi:hypothetical protein
MPTVAAPVSEKVRLIFQSKHPHKTVGLTLWVPVEDEPTQLYTALEKIGWKKQSFPVVSPLEARQWLNKGYAKNDTTMIREVFFYHEGDGVFHEWTDEQRKKYMPQVRKVLRQFGFENVMHQKLTLADCL